MNDEERILVEEELKDEETARKANGALFFFSTSVLAAVIIIGSAYTINNKKNTTTTKTINTITADANIGDSKSSNEEISEEDIVEKIVKEVKQSKTAPSKEIDYTNVKFFYEEILNNRSKYNNFAESFQSEEDVKNFINFFYKFDELYSVVDTTTSINSQKEFDEIVSDYYKSCASHNVDANLSSLFKEGSMNQVKLAEAEKLANNLKNGKGKDYSISNLYYAWFEINLYDDRTSIPMNMKNSPLIDLLREQYEQYRYVGNMLDARKNQKNDTLPAAKVEAFNAFEYPEDVKVTENNNSFSCPDGVDNFVSKSEEFSETKHNKHIGDATFFKIVDENFETVLSQGRTK